jgi:site-specific DNA recombinase
MQTADLYIRVSTDEQADKGYSQRYQEEVLKRYCDFHKITVRNIYFEDHSAKTFRRPQFIKLLVDIKKNRGGNLLLFTKWDRFSRNTADAYAMINTLNKLGIDPQAVEQPLDLTIPENKMMLAVYLAQPEVENDRRSLNVAGGMRRAKKEGRWMGTAPLGYNNKCTESGKKYIDIDPVQGPIMQWVFNEIAEGTFTIQSVYEEAKKKGLRSSYGKLCSKNNFWNALRLPVYHGKIFVSAYKTEEATLVTGQHPPLISEALFNQVQDVLDGKKRPRGTKKNSDDRFPLRGFIRCDFDGRLLTASSSRGKMGRYYDYYHCTGDCKVRHAADKIHSSFHTELSKWKPHYAVKQLYKLFLQDIYSQEAKQRSKQLKNIQEEIIRLQERQKKNRELLLEEKIEADDYRIIKNECSRSIAQLDDQLATLVEGCDNIEPLVNDALDVLENIDIHYINLPTGLKRELVSSMFPNKLSFDGFKVRTPAVNEAVRIIYSLGEGFSQIKMRQAGSLSDLSHQVTPLVHFSNSFLHDLKKLSRLYQLIKAA